MRMRFILIGIAAGLGACAADPVYTPPADQTVRDYVTAAQLEEIYEIRKGDRDTWIYVTDRFVIYRSRLDDYLLEFQGGELQQADGLLQLRRHGQLLTNSELQGWSHGRGSAT